MTHDRERWVVLRRSAAAGAIGGSDDGAGARTPSLTTWEVAVSCDHGELAFEVEIDAFIDLIAAMTTLGYRHKHAFRCGCLDPDDIAAHRAVTAWRDAYGHDPFIQLGDPR